MNDANKILLDENESLKHQNYILSERIKELEEANYKLNRDIFELKNNAFFRDAFYFRDLSVTEKIKHIKYVADPRFGRNPDDFKEYQLRRILRDFYEISDAFIKMAEHGENENPENENDKNICTEK